MNPGGTAMSLPVRWTRRAARLGAAVRSGFARLGSVSWILGKGLQAASRLRGEQLRVVLEVTRQQIRFTALDALPLCVVMALLLGAITLLQVFGQLSGYGAESYLSRLLARLVIRELGPLMVGILVIVRSGTAIATEIASRKLSGELAALWASGIDPFGYVLVPRLLGGIVSVFTLVIVFDTVALLGGFLVAWLRLPLSFSFFLGELGAAIGPRELMATFSKCLVFGTGIPLLCAAWGARVRHSTTEIPQAVTRAAVGSLLVLVLAGALLSVVIYG
jgi:phospholipid/cholesterol/gamma-HCH transport system permease protein